ncbi:unnamed protein product, partial [Onchocerca ochengi]|uniref:Pecanex-like protein n=1 Tax=Onchocerca ochengi TaxID=42157 RepID=A0A182ESV4_ONCOC
KKPQQLTKMKRKKEKNIKLHESSTYTSVITDDVSNEISNVKSKQPFILSPKIQFDNMPQQLPAMSSQSTIIEYDEAMNDEENDNKDSLNEKIKTSISINDENDNYDDNNDKPSLQIANNGQLASKILPITNNQENKDIKHIEFSANTEQQQISGINKNDFHQSYQLSDIANYLAHNVRITVGDIEDNANKQIPDKIHDQELLKVTTTTTSESLITGYPDETTGSTRLRFIYVTKRPRQD